MTLTRQHFKSLAEHLGTAIKEIDGITAIPEDIRGTLKDILINEINAFCREWNGNFKADRFEDAVNKARGCEDEPSQEVKE